MQLQGGLAAVLAAPEDSRLEFKEAANRYDFEELVRYCVALANEGGGKIVLGVTDKRPRQVIGTQAFGELGRTEAGLFEKLRQRLSLEEHWYEGKRIVVVHVPSRLPGAAWQYRGAFWMRAGESLVPMTDEQLRRIHDETGPDFSSEICPGTTVGDLAPPAIERFRDLWQRKVPDQDLTRRTGEQLLADAELVVPGGVTYAALALLGTREALGRYLGQAEVVFEYRASESLVEASDRREFRQGFLTALDDLWDLVNLRNGRESFLQGLFVWDIPTFDERAVREGILNAVSHRDYRSGASVFIRQYPRRLEIVSPGGFPQGITQENIIWRQNPRNRRIAEALSKCGLVERAGQGFDLIFRQCIRQGKRLPDLSRTDSHFVWLTLHGEIQDKEFLRYLELVGREKMASFSTEDFLVLDLVHRDQVVPEILRSQLPRLLELGVIERFGRGRGVRYILSRHFYQFLRKGGVYTQRRGLDRETNKALLLRHISESQSGGARMEELRQVLPTHSRSQIQVLLRELRNGGRIHVHGSTRGARWYPGEANPNCNHEGSRLQ